MKFYFQERSIFNGGGGCIWVDLVELDKDASTKIRKYLFLCRGHDAIELGSVDQRNQSLLCKTWVDLFLSARITQRSKGNHFPWF